MSLKKTDRCVCTYCWERFASFSSWMAHRDGDEFSGTRRCMEPAEMEAIGMRKTLKVYWLFPYRKPKALGLLRGVGPKLTRKVSVRL